MFLFVFTCLRDKNNDDDDDLQQRSCCLEKRRSGIENENCGLSLSLKKLGSEFAFCLTVIGRNFLSQILNVS